MKLKKIEASNYRSFENIDVELSEGINVIFGETDTGKSNIFRLLSLWAFNGSGDSFITAGEKKCTIDIDGIKLEKGRKGKGLNRYSYKDEVYDNVGINCPDEINNITKIKEVSFGNISKKINFISQKKPFFIIGENKFDNAKILGHISNIHVIHGAIKIGNKKLRSTKKDLQNNEMDFEAKKTELQEYKNLKEVKVELNECNELIDEIEKLNIDIVNIEFMRDNLIEVIKDSKKIDNELDKLSGIEDIDFEELIKLNDKIDIVTEMNYELLFVCSEELKIKSDISLCDDDIKVCDLGIKELVSKIDICPITNDKMPKTCKEKILKNGN